eukprot:gene6135-biopygen7927
MHDLEQVTQLQQQQQQQHQQPPHVQISEHSDSAAAQQQVPSRAPAGQQQQQQRPLTMPQLVLRQWHDLRPEREFRCFVHQHRPVAISQRDVSQCFPQLMAPEEVQCIRKQILEFHASAVNNSFPCHSSAGHSSVVVRVVLEDFGRDDDRVGDALDLYVPSSGRVMVVDVNPITDSTSPLLFSWAELPYNQMHSHQSHAQHSSQQQQHLQQNMAAVEALMEADVELRVLTDAGVVHPGMRAATGMPVDMLGLPQAFDQVLQAMTQQQMS